MGMRFGFFMAINLFLESLRKCLKTTFSLSRQNSLNDQNGGSHEILDNNKYLETAKNGNGTTKDNAAEHTNNIILNVENNNKSPKMNDSITNDVRNLISAPLNDMDNKAIEERVAQIQVTELFKWAVSKNGEINIMCARNGTHLV